MCSFKIREIKTVAITNNTGVVSVNTYGVLLASTSLVIPPPRAVRNAEINTPRISSL